MAYRLPPLNAVRQFEAVARHLSFRAAAEELRVTPSAVSHGIQALEDWLGVPLFVRDHRNLTLSPAGAAFLPRVQDALNILVSATTSLPKAWGSRISISAAPSFATRWLLPNLHRFYSAHPDIEIAIDTSPRHVDFPRDSVDLAIRRGEGNWGEVAKECLFYEELVPVCAPGIASSIRTPEDLAKQTLLHVTTAAEDWAAWAALSNLPQLDTSRGFRFDTLDLAWSAAAEGLGVAIGRLPLVNPEFEDGRLVPILRKPLKGHTAYWLVTAPGTLSRREVAAFAAWLKAELLQLNEGRDHAPR